MDQGPRHLYRCRRLAFGRRCLAPWFGRGMARSWICEIAPGLGGVISPGARATCPNSLLQFQVRSDRGRPVVAARPNAPSSAIPDTSMRVSVHQEMEVVRLRTLGLRSRANFGWLPAWR